MMTIDEINDLRVNASDWSRREIIDALHDACTYITVLRAMYEKETGKYPEFEVKTLYGSSEENNTDHPDA